MPFTPFHFGPGLFFKSLTPRSFSFVAFVSTQVVIDCETLLYIVRNEWPLHRFLHSVPGGLVVAVVVVAAMLVGRRIVGAEVLKQLNATYPETLAIVAGSVVGGVSHSILDDIMHDDVKLLYPSNAGPDLQGLVGLGELHLLCVTSGVVGLAVLALRRWRAG